MPSATGHMPARRLWRWPVPLVPLAPCAAGGWKTAGHSRLAVSAAAGPALSTAAGRAFNAAAGRALSTAKGPPLRKSAGSRRSSPWAEHFTTPQSALAWHSSPITYGSDHSNKLSSTAQHLARAICSRGFAVHSPATPTLAPSWLVSPAPPLAGWPHVRRPRAGPARHPPPRPCPSAAPRW